MFDEVTKREGGKRAAKRGAWVAVSSAVQALLVVAIIVVSTKIAADVANAPTVDVKFVKQAAPPPPPPPPPPPAAPRAKPKPKTDAPKPVKPNPMAMVQPKDVPDELKPPDPNEPEEEEGEGVEGGVIGGVAGGVSGGTAGGQAGGIVDAPVYATAGFKKPAAADPGCVARSVRLPSEVLDSLGGPVTVKFAVGRDGTPSQFQVVSVARDPRVSGAIWQAIQGCRWIAGADAQGRPTSIWVIMPIRFAID